MSIDWYRVAVGTRDDVRLVAFMDAYDMARCLARLGACLAQAGAMQAMYEAGANGEHERNPWRPNTRGRAAPGWRP